MERVFFWRARATWRGGAVAPLFMGFAKFREWLVLLLREGRWAGESSRQFTRDYTTHEQGRDCVLGGSPPSLCGERE